MKVYLLGGSSSEALDEGMHNVTHRLGRELSRRHEVRTFPLRVSSFVGLYRSLAGFQPDILHYTSGPSLLSLFLLKIAGLSSPCSKTAVSALHPWFPWGVGNLIPLFRPDLMLVQSRVTEKFFNRYGCRTAFLSNGVELARFKPVSPEMKSALRAEFGLPDDKCILLHVGAIKAGRGVGFLQHFQGGDQQVLVVGSVSTGYDSSILDALESRGCWIWRRFIPDIEKVYQLADCYLFPTQDSLNAIETPLSVLEAMATNLPVITTPFGALADTFPEGEGLIYAKNSGEFAEGIRHIREDRFPIRTREKVLGNSWEEIIGRLENYYRLLLGAKRT
jgi:glycosyltransferase involved in cell wall biosynthesis